MISPADLVKASNATVVNLTDRSRPVLAKVGSEFDNF